MVLVGERVQIGVILQMPLDKGITHLWGGEKINDAFFENEFRFECIAHGFVCCKGVWHHLIDLPGVSIPTAGYRVYDTRSYLG